MRLLTALLMLSMGYAQASVDVIYGDDNRMDIYAVKNPMYAKLAKSTAAMIPNKNLRSAGSTYKINASTLAQRGMCRSERFANQPTAANCSGFLVGPDLLVTAGHCVKSIRSCADITWVFDYKMNSKTDINLNIPTANAYKCVKVIEQSLSRSTKDDYALVKLDRVVKGRTPLKFRQRGKIRRNADIFVIGHPTGLPSKVADGASVRSNSNKYFTANLDTYGGNSGSAVFNARTYEVEGILVRGEQDYVSRGGCRASNTIGHDSGRGEDVTYITNIKALKNL
jgi:hypothetical protein